MIEKKNGKQTCLKPRFVLELRFPVAKKCSKALAI